MPTAVEKIFDEAFSLPADTRLGLVEKLFSSLNLPTQTEIDRSWAEEAERRAAQIDRGEVELIPGEKVFETIREKYPRPSFISTQKRTRNSMRRCGTTRIFDPVSVSNSRKK